MLIPEPNKDFLFGKSIGEAIPASFPKRNRKTLFQKTWKDLASSGIVELLTPGKITNPEKVVSVLEGLGYGCKNNSIVVALGANCFAVGSVLNEFAVNKNQRDLLKKLRNGKEIGGFAVTEEGAGSDAMSMQCNYKETENGFILNGKKSYIKNNHDASFFIVFATKNPKLYHRGISAFIVPANAKGVSIGNDEPRMGLNNSSLGSVKLKDVFVPKWTLLGKEKMGNQIFNHGILFERSLIFAASIGTMRRLLEDSIAFAKRRKQFKKPLSSFQMVQTRIVDICKRYVVFRLLINETARSLYAGTLTPGFSALTKMSLSEALLKTCEDTYRIYGAFGYLEKSGISSQINDAFGGVILSGTSEIQRLIIGGEIGL